MNVPGIDGTGELIFKQLPGLAKHFRVATFKLRESGEFSYRDLAGDIAAIIRDVGEERAMVAGESFGGTVALWFALLYPNMLERLVIINSFPRFRNRLKISAARRLAYLLPPRAVWVLRAAGNSVGLYVDGVAAEERRRCRSIIKTAHVNGIRRRLELIEELDLVPRLSEIEAPTLFIAADRDLLLPSVREARLMASRIPNATIKVAQGAGHACLLGDRVSLETILLNWAARPESGG
ncbi:MAG TPA: alpha/beta hydrolase [Blastocatellia bacterium]